MINAEKYFPAQLAELAEKPFLFTPPLIYKWRGGINRLGRIVFGIEGVTAMKIGNSMTHSNVSRHGRRTAAGRLYAQPQSVERGTEHDRPQERDASGQGGQKVLQNGFSAKN